MPDVAKWNRIDDRTHNYMMYSPYGYALNNPGNNIDYNVNALKKHSGYSNKELQKIFTWGQGPELNPEDLGEDLAMLGRTDALYADIKGELKYVPGSSTVNINIDLFEQLEAANEDDLEYILFLTAVTILHETTHYGFNEHYATVNSNEEGNEFEKDAYGEVIKMNNYRQVLDNYKNGGSSSNQRRLKFTGMDNGGWSGQIPMGGTTNKKLEDEKSDADREAAKRSGGAH